MSNKRLSRLQGVILKVLAAIHPGGYPKRVLPKVVGGLYGKGSIITAQELFKGGKHQVTLPDPLGVKTLEASEFNLITEMRLLKWTQGGREDWTSPKFSVSYSRSIRSLLAQGLVAYSPMTNNKWALFITEKGLAKIEGRKVKVKADLWDEFIHSIKKGGKK